MRLSIYMNATHVPCVYVFEHVKELFLETAAVGSIIRSAGKDIPRMPSSGSDLFGESFAETKDAHT